LRDQPVTRTVVIQISSCSERGPSVPSRSSPTPSIRQVVELADCFPDWPLANSPRKPGACSRRALLSVGKEIAGLGWRRMLVGPARSRSPPCQPTRLKARGLACSDHGVKVNRFVNRGAERPINKATVTSENPVLNRALMLKKSGPVSHDGLRFNVGHSGAADIVRQYRPNGHARRFRARGPSEIKINLEHLFSFLVRGSMPCRLTCAFRAAPPRIPSATAAGGCRRHRGNTVKFPERFPRGPPPNGSAFGHVEAAASPRKPSDSQSLQVCHDFARE